MPVPMPIIRWFLKFAESEINLLKDWKTGMHQIFEAIETTTDNGKTDPTRRGLVYYYQRGQYS
jgi:hypothetical protein